MLKFYSPTYSTFFNSLLYNKNIIYKYVLCMHNNKYTNIFHI